MPRVVGLDGSDEGNLVLRPAPGLAATKLAAQIDLIYLHARDGWSSAEGYKTFNLASGNTSPQDLADPRVFLTSGQDGQDHIDASLASLAVEFDNEGNLAFGSAATADPYATAAAAAPADAATVEVINLATPVTHDLLWAA